jgi:hypothetical protein
MRASFLPSVRLKAHRQKFTPLMRSSEHRGAADARGKPPVRFGAGQPEKQMVL